MNIVEHYKNISPGIALEIQQLFFTLFNEHTSEDFLERVNEKPDLIVLLAYEGPTLVGFKLGYYLAKGIFKSWLGGVHPDHRKKRNRKSVTQKAAPDLQGKRL